MRVAIRLCSYAFLTRWRDKVRNRLICVNFLHSFGSIQAMPIRPFVFFFVRYKNSLRAFAHASP